MSLFIPFATLVISMLGSRLFGNAGDTYMAEAQNTQDNEERSRRMKIAAIAAVIRLILVLVATMAFLHIAHEVFSYYGIA